MSSARDQLEAVFNGICAVLAQYERGADEPPTDEDAEAIYRQFCHLGALLGPAISQHLQRLGHEHIPETAFDKMPKVPAGADAPGAVRRFNSHVLAQLLLDLKPAIADAFLRPGEVQSIVVDLIHDNDIVALRDRRKETEGKRGAGARPNRHVKAVARAYLYDLVVFEAARRSAGLKRPIGESGLCEQLTTRGRAIAFNQDNWKALAREQKRLMVDTSAIRERGRQAGDQPHERLGEILRLAEAAKL